MTVSCMSSIGGDKRNISSVHYEWGDWYIPYENGFKPSRMMHQVLHHMPVFESDTTYAGNVKYVRKLILSMYSNLVYPKII
jgi:hypothetical protein